MFQNAAARPHPSTAFLVCIVPFLLLATLNSGGYRYGASDQAFYLPAIFLHLDQELFPRDAAVLTAQTGLTLVDDIIGSIVRVTGVAVPALFAILYGVSLLLLAWGAWRIGGSLYQRSWTMVALLAALTLRHAIARSGTNTLEGYFHPRVLAFGIGTLAVSAFLRGRVAIPLALVALAAAVHPTTALWFLVWLASAAVIARPALRPYLLAGASLSALAGVWALTSGPLAGRLSIMDPEWRRMLATKDYLFPLEWPPYAWVLNVGYLPLIAWIHRVRSRAGLVRPFERALVLGSAALAVIFAGALVLHGIGVVLAIQLQPARLFWMFDFLATIYAVWAIAEGGVFRVGTAPRLAALVLIAFSTARGLYVLADADRRPFQLTIPDDDWGRVMAFARTTDTGSGWLADPMHAVRYGTSVRVGGRRDVLVEAVKDAAIGMYDRDIAVRTAERLGAVPDFLAVTAGDATRIGRHYDLDFMITEQQLDLPLAFESGALRVYRLK